MRGIRFAASIGSALALLVAIAAPSTASTTSTRYTIDCTESPICLELANPAEAFGSTKYVGHDEPSLLFYSNKAGSGNSSTYRLTLPKDPPPLKTNTFNFQLHPAFWFGMALCNTQSFPVQVSTCTPDSDSNIANNPNPSALDFMGRHAGTAFLELQFYPPGWAPLPAGDSCDASHWCVATVIWSLAEDPINGTLLNTSCTNFIGGIEYPNYAFLTKNGVPQAPANVIDSTRATFTPDLSKDLLMNSGDQVVVDIHDTAHGLSTTVKDLSSGVTGSMVASAANGFGMVQYVTDPATTCNNIPYDFHPMYSTSSEATRVIWAAHSYNVAFSDEIGHFDYCTGVSQGGYCYGNEGSSADTEKTDGDDYGCFNAAQSTLVKVAGCIGTNTGFDGVPYHAVWPDGNTANHPTAILFGSPTTGGRNYSRVAFEADLPRIEAADYGGPCNRTTGVGCTRIPVTDDGTPADFYPFFSTQSAGGSCAWALGNDNPGVTTNDFGKNDQYGPQLFLNYLAFGGHGTSTTRTNDFRGVLSNNPCPASGQEGAGN